MNKVIVAVVALLLPASWSMAANKYWEYSDQGIDVVAGRSDDRAVDIVHNLLRLDKAIKSVLTLSGDGWRPPTLMYSVPHDDFVRLMGKTDIVARSHPSWFRNDVILDADLEDSDNAFFDVYFGFTATVLRGSGVYGHPYWYTQGLSELFAASTMRGDTVTIGTFSQNQANMLMGGRTIPMKELLTIRSSDQRFASDPDFFSAFNTESWFLTHQILIEGKYRDEFNRYFAALETGASEDQAFASSFSMSYDELEKWFRQTVKAQVIHVIRVQQPDVKTKATARLMTDAESAAALSVFAVRHGQKDFALTLANRALAADPGNRTAQLSLVELALDKSDFPQALTQADKACSDAIDAAIAARCGIDYGQLAEAVSAQRATLPESDSDLAAKARKALEQATTANPDDVASWYQLTELTTARKDRDYAKIYLPRAQQMLYSGGHSRNPQLVNALMRLCLMIGNYDDAFKFAVAWQKNAPSVQERQTASDQVSELKAFLERRRAAGGAPAQ